MVIQLTQIEVRGQSESGPFSGTLDLGPGLQVISAPNAYGKSLAVTSIAWCLGAEAIFGNADNDSSCFPEGARDEVDLPGRPSSKVFSSECSITFVDEKGRHLKLTRAIKGDSTTIRVRESSPQGDTKETKLLARRHTMQDESGGFQRFLFNWLGWPREEVATLRGTPAEVYLENLAPCFYIDQEEGWTNVQALQISRYGQQEISEISVEYLLGAVESVHSRVLRHLANQKSLALRDTARQTAERITLAFLRRGWRVEWSGHGSISEIITRWSSRTVRDALKQDANIDLAEAVLALETTAQQLRQQLTTSPLDPEDATPPIAASRRVVALKERRHKLSEQLHGFRMQRNMTAELLDNLEHRIHAAMDLLRLKTTGVGRLDHVECPTCHRDLDPATFALTEQSAASVETHIEALKRDRELMSRNLRSLDAELETTGANLIESEEQLRDSERALGNVTLAVGAAREKLAEVASELNNVERAIDRSQAAAKELDDFQAAVDRWLVDANSIIAPGTLAPDLQQRRDVFLAALRKYLVALGHSALRSGNPAQLTLDDEYTPYLGSRRLRALGSASDKSRLVAAYSLALAAASGQIDGLHPGIVTLDEPLQQNPDPDHRKMFIAFLSQELARNAKFQTLIFTSLSDDEIDALRKQGTTIVLPEGEHFLKPLIRPPNPKT